MGNRSKKKRKNKNSGHKATTEQKLILATAVIELVQVLISLAEKALEIIEKLNE